MKAIAIYKHTKILYHYKINMRNTFQRGALSEILNQDKVHTYGIFLKIKVPYKNYVIVNSKPLC